MAEKTAVSADIEGTLMEQAYQDWLNSPEITTFEALTLELLHLQEDKGDTLRGFASIAFRAGAEHGVKRISAIFEQQGLVK